MSQGRQATTPFVLGTPIRNPGDFYGRGDILRQVYDLILAGQLVAVVGEHRCGNTSVLFQLLHPDVRERYLRPDEDANLRFVFVSAQLGAESPEAFLRRVALALHRADTEANVDFSAPADQTWLENYLEDLGSRGRRLVLLVDEIEVLAGLDPAFFEWLQGVVTEYGVAIVASARQDLGEFRADRDLGPPLFNMFGTLWIGSFEEETVREFLTDKTQMTDFDFARVRDDLGQLAGRFPYYLQVASALMYVEAGGDSHLTDEQMERVRREFRSRTMALFEDMWQKLPGAEREALVWRLIGARPTNEAGKSFDKALHSLERRGYIVDGRIFSTALEAYVRKNARHVAVLADSGQARIGTTLVHLPARELALLELFVARTDQIVAPGEIEEAVWRRRGDDRRPVTPDMVTDLVTSLERSLDLAEDLVEVIPDHGFVFHNPPLLLDGNGRRA